MSPRSYDPRTAAAHQAAGLFALASVLIVTGLRTDHGRVDSVLALTGADLAVAVASVLLPWHRWPHRATLALVVPAVGLIAAAHALDLVPVRSYGVVFVLLFAWVGIHHPRRTSLVIAPFTALGYALPIVLTDTEPPLDLRAMVFALAVGIVVAETMAANVATSVAARGRARRAAESFATVGRATSRLVTLEGAGVLDAVVDTVIELGYDGVHLGVVDRSTGTFTAAHARGIAEGYGGERFPISAGLTGLVVTTGEPVVVDDYQQSALVLPAIKACGARTTIAVPVIAGDELVAVLLAHHAQVRRVQAEDLEALKTLAAHAGAAHGVVGRLAAERHLAATSAQESRTDPLTGIANRRRAQEVLGDLAVGDSVALVDVDHFKAVNDTLGHAAGDELLREIALFLAANVRAGDHLARFGGEEFLIVLPHTPVTGAAYLLDRLRRRWEATNPIATFSAGAAEHEADDFAPVTLARADASLYRAKTHGRNRVDAAAPSSGGNG
jgi:diguanylate cyclase (GGDEF)-like protein